MKAKKRSRRWFVKQIKRALEGKKSPVEIEVAHEYQEQPNTYVALKVYTIPHVVVGGGFSKVCRPDVFDKETGWDIALGKAIGSAAKKLADLTAG